MKLSTGGFKAVGRDLMTAKRFPKTPGNLAADKSRS